MITKLDIRNLFFGNLVLSYLNRLASISTKCVGVGDYSFAVNSTAVKRLICRRLVNILKPRPPKRSGKLLILVFLSFFYSSHKFKIGKEKKQ